jgi:hypothetical protein
VAKTHSLAEFERDLIRTRTSEGRARAVARGMKLGPKPKLTPHQQREAIKRRDRGDDRRHVRGLDVEKSRGGYTLVDPRNGMALARLKPIPQSDRFELFYWSDMRGR